MPNFPKKKRDKLRNTITLASGVNVLTATCKIDRVFNNSLRDWLISCHTSNTPLAHPRLSANQIKELRVLRSWKDFTQPLMTLINLNKSFFHSIRIFFCQLAVCFQIQYCTLHSLVAGRSPSPIMAPA